MTAFSTMTWNDARVMVAANGPLNPPVFVMHCVGDQCFLTVTLFVTDALVLLVSVTFWVTEKLPGFL
jgi:hypothetical protein